MNRRIRTIVLPVGSALAVGGIAVAAAVGAGHAGGAQDPTLMSAARSSATLQVQQVAQNALQVNTALQRPLVDVPGDLPDAAAFARQITEGTAALRSVFAAGAALDKEVAALQSAVQEESASGDHFRVLDAGADPAAFDTVAVTGTTATVDGTVGTFSRMRFRNPDGTWVEASPTTSSSST